MDMEKSVQWNEGQLAVGELSISYLKVPWDKHRLEYLKADHTRNLLMLWKYIHHLVMDAQVSSVSGDEFSILFPENFCKIMWMEFMTWRLNDSTMSHSPITNAGHRGQLKLETNQNAQNLLSFKKNIKEKYLSTQSSRMRIILKPSKVSFGDCHNK